LYTIFYLLFVPLIFLGFIFLSFSFCIHDSIDPPAERSSMLVGEAVGAAIAVTS
jgi:hypothetical protein